MNRWLKHGALNDTLTATIKNIKKPQNWIIITEPWCGDAAHLVPFMEMIAEINPLISTEYELRDSPPFRINDYLTGISKSIPILVIKDKNGEDYCHWGPRPKEANELYKGMVRDGVGFEETKTALQQWYNKDKGQSLQKELLGLLN